MDHARVIDYMKSVQYMIEACQSSADINYRHSLRLYLQCAPNPAHPADYLIHIRMSPDHYKRDPQPVPLGR